MLVLLPPSEGKATDGDGPPLDLDSLTLPGLRPAREQVMAALAEVCSGPEEEAREVLGLSPTQADALKRNLSLETAPTLRADQLYTGVLYDRLGLGDLPRTDRVLIFSGLWGAVGPADRLPPYRLSMGVKLPPLGGLAAYWRREAKKELEGFTGDHLLVDCRSSAYAAAYKSGAALPVRVLRERVVDGQAKRSVVSHMAKATRGDIARSLLLENVDARTPEELTGALRDLGYTVELDRGRLDVVVRD
ncbi:peroxide stress protein YaaA [Nocardiopsis sp. HNM0947]|uniref:Peroxide stress protein YaaA n=1 Tax=Nocardiopsis coralli TaxID=2772213 RepID=A0ABR9P411_9ACTN|nr:peroxide stress protein YaaA [Nocardiopsis coralli]MBE2998582.1 peroxide stress protein YaaA [Nocardiopsis coralli]